MAEERSGADIRKLFDTNGGADPEGSTSEGARIRSLFPSGGTDTQATTTTDKPWRSQSDRLRDLPQDLPDLSKFLTVKGWREALAPEPGWVPSGILPIETRETAPGSGQGNADLGWRFTMKPVVTAPIHPLLDFMEGTGQATSVGGEKAPLAGTVSPAATLALLGAKAGNPSPFQPKNALRAPATGADIKFGPATADEFGASVPQTPYHPDSPNYVPPGAAAPEGGAPGGGAAPGRQVTTTEPSPGMGSGPAPAGAQVATAAEARLSAEQAAEYGSVADKQWLYKSKMPGEADPTVYIEGINPTMAQREQTAVAARETKDVRNLSSEAQQMEEELLAEHNNLRKNHFQETAGSDVTQGIAIREADQRISDGLEAAYSAGGKVDPEGITAAIQAERDAPSGKLPAVKSVMKAIEDALEKADGTGLETDPRQVHGVRRVINFLQSKHGIAENPAYGARDVQAALIRVKEAIDNAIEPAAPGFRAAIDEYSHAQRAIEAQEALQKAEAKLYDDKGRLQFSRFHRFMNDVIQSRDPRAPLNPYQSLTEAQMARLKSLHDDLQRVATAEELAKARGSDTTANFIGAVRRAAQGVPGTVAAGIAGHIFGGPGGAVVAPVIKGQIESLFTRGAERRATRDMGNLLRPDPTKYPTRPNPLNQPPEAP